MCMIKVRPEIEEEHTVPARVMHREVSHRGSRAGSRRSRSSMRGDHETTTIIETIKAPPPPPSSIPLYDSRGLHTTIIQNAHPPSAPSISDLESRHGGSGGAGHWDHGSPRASIVSTRSRDVDYYVDSSAAYGGRSPRGSYRYVDGPRGSSQRITDGGMKGSRKELEYSGSHRGGERHGYNNFHGRRSGSVNYVNPRQSAISQRSARSGREKVMVVDEFGTKRYY